MKGGERTSNNGMEILIVEDSTTQAEQLRYILECNGFQVYAANNGKEALVMLAERKPSFVLSDIVMPEMDGYELCKHIKADDDLRNIPVILVTVLSDASDVAKALECGADNFITKPYDEEFLLSRIQNIKAGTQLQHTRNTEKPLEISIAGQIYYITSERMQILDLLLSTYELAIQRNEELQKANTQLETRVTERTVELTQANQELEAFSYSVSHDLQAPLRSMDGFSQILLEGYSDKLDEQGKDYLQRVRSATQRMGMLVDDMLSLSRVTRGEMKQEFVDLSSLVQSITTELQKSQPERQIEFITTPGVTANGDDHLLRILLENLLGNAWKFTGKHPTARIEFGTTQVAGEQVFFVRDDGVGFDMTYADGLFVAFQRLHAADDFPGTGVGLATVQRIVQRHGGRVWAEGEVEKGATFYFTL